MNKVIYLSLATACVLSLTNADEVEVLAEANATEEISVAKVKKIKPAKKLSLEDRVKMLEARLAESDAKIAELTASPVTAATIKKLDKKISEVKAHDAFDNIKWGADLRTAVDSLDYKMADGTSKTKNALMSTRLLLNMGYAPDANNIFKGQLAYNKAFGADFTSNGNPNARPRGWGMDTFDWITNESLSGNGLKVKQAYWLYMGDSIGGAEIPWTASVGRRPSTDGMLSNFRQGDTEYQSPLAHMIDVEFDGASFSANFGNVSGIPGLGAKLCLGQGSTSAAPMFSGATNYTDNDNMKDIRLAGVILTPYDDGQIVSKVQLYRAWNLPGYDMNNMMLAMLNQPAAMSQFGNIDGYAWSTLVNGIGDEGILADAKFFASLAMSKTHPDGNPEGMLGSTDSETGTSVWVGAQLPLLGGNFGLEYNKGSKYWRPFTYGEDTMAGPKLAVRGNAYEAYYVYPLSKALTAEARYTYMDYDYTGSNNFFGRDGAPMSISDIKMGAAGGDPMAIMMSQMIVDKATDLRFSIRYKF